MRKPFYSRKTRHIVKYSPLIAAALLNCASAMADEPSKTVVSIPSADTSKFVYNGSSQTYTLAENASYTIFGNTHKSAGEYEVTVSLNNTTLCEWEDGSVESKSFKFVINKLQVEVPAADTSHFVYTGEQQTYTIAESEDYIVENFRKTNAGNHKVTVSLNDTTNYEWADATIADKIYNFVIGKTQIEIPAADTTKFTYNGAVLTYVIKPSIDYTISGNTQTNAGNHTVTVAIVNAGNCEWADGTSEPKTFNFDISKASVEVPSAKKDTFEFDGKNKFFEIPEDSKYTIDITNETAANVGVYDRTVSLNDVQNYCWADNTIEPKKITFVIEEGKVKIPEAKEYTYTGALIQLVSETTFYSVENGSGVNVGEYTVRLGLKPNYIWENGTKDTLTVTAQILPILVDEPNVNSGIVTYDGTVYTLTVPENQAYIVSGISSGKEPGTYITLVSLKPNYAWSDATTGSLTYKLKIERAKVSIPSADTSVFYYNQKEQVYQIEDNIHYTVVGNKQTAIGSHEITVTLNDTIHYEWADATVKPKHYQFEIVEIENFSFEVMTDNVSVAPGEELTINLGVDGYVQYYKINNSLFPELKDSLIAFDNETSTIKLPMSANITPGKYKLDVILVSGSSDKPFSVNMTINYPASDIIVCWNDVVAVDNSKVKSTTYQWYKNGELIPGATSHYYNDKDGLCGYYMCEVDGGLFVGPVYLNFGRPLYLTAHGENGRIVASVVGSTTAKVRLMSVGGMLTDAKTASEEMIFTVRPGIYVLTLDGTDQSVKVIVK